VSNKFNKSAFCIALALITLASLFKIYFALLGIVIVTNCAAFVRLRTVVSVVFIWICLTAVLFFGLSRAFPFYFDSIYFMQRMLQTWSFQQILDNIDLFLREFWFIFVLAVPQLAQYRHLTSGEKRRQKFYCIGSTIVCAYLILVMLAHEGNIGIYVQHILAPIVLAYALSGGAKFAPGKFRRTAQIAALAMCVTAFIDPLFPSESLRHWTLYGVLWRDDLDSNKKVFVEADDLIRNSAGKQIYVGPILAPLAIQRHLSYIDNGFRQYIARYLNARRNGKFKPSRLISWLAGPKPGGPERESPHEMMARADVVICMNAACPDLRSHQFVRNLGELTASFNDESFDAKLYRRAGANEVH
jgi:hypothetical protein